MWHGTESVSYLGPKICVYVYVYIYVFQVNILDNLFFMDETKSRITAKVFENKFRKPTND